MTIQSELQDLSSARIDHHAFDILRDELSFDLTSVWHGVATEHKLKLRGVSAIYYVSDDGEQRFDLPPFETGDTLNLTAAYYVPESIGETSTIIGSPDWGRIGDQRYPSTPNFVFRLSGTWLFVEASSIKIGDKEYPAKLNAPAPIGDKAADGSYTLAIYGHRLNFELISERLGLLPTDTVNEGQLISRALQRRAPSDAWIHSVDFERASDEPLVILLKQLSDQRHFFDALRQAGHEVRLTCYLRSDFGQLGIELGAEAIDLLNRVGLGLSFDVISFGMVRDN